MHEASLLGIKILRKIIKLVEFFKNYRLEKYCVEENAFEIHGVIFFYIYLQKA